MHWKLKEIYDKSEEVQDIMSCTDVTKYVKTHTYIWTHFGWAKIRKRQEIMEGDVLKG